MNVTLTVEFVATSDVKFTTGWEFNGFPALKKESARSTNFSETSTHEFPSMGSWNKDVFVFVFLFFLTFLTFC